MGTIASDNARVKGKHSSQLLLLAIAGILVVVSGATAVVWNDKLEHRNSPVTATPTVVAASSDVKAAFTTLSYKGQKGKTALELLKLHAVVTTIDSKKGPYVESIGGVKNGTEGKYWLMYVNGQKPTTSANAYITSDSDTIDWRLE